ncbi:MAG TPA: hypothetical protein VFF73_38330 [Planctomycetota bacterium]|nr:hypothetical protein [Planctomycetota bacterium]
MRLSGFTSLEALLVSAILGLAATLLTAACASAAKRHGEERCANNLRRIAMAAMCYSDDKRFFPHRAPLRERDGGVESDTAARALRALVHYTYLEDTESFVCPSSPDEASPAEVPITNNPRSFTWAGGREPPAPSDESPLYSRSDAGDRPLNEMTDLSYGWTRVSVTTNSPPMVILAGDKARVVPERADEPARQGHMAGNHRECIQVTYQDAHVTRIEPASELDWLTTHNIAATERRPDSPAGYLGVLGD